MRILILHHAHTDLAEPRYLVQHLARAWSEAGHRVSHVKNIRVSLPAADLVFLHVDLTRVPEDYLRALPEDIPVINHGITDISKSRISRHVLRQGERYPLPVIVKTECNYGGRPELRAARLTSRMRGRLDWRSWFGRARTRPGHLDGEADDADWENITWLKEYPIYPATDAVPPGVWANPRLIVEKYLPERDENGQLRLREWVVFGDRELHTLKTSSAPVAKSHTIVSREDIPVEQVPPELRAVRERLRVDYAKFDYVLHDGEMVLYDINKTIGAPAALLADGQVAERIGYLSGGIDSFLKMGG